MGNLQAYTLSLVSCAPTTSFVGLLTHSGVWREANLIQAERSHDPYNRMIHCNERWKCFSIFYQVLL